MPTYSQEWDQGDYRANNETRKRMGFGGTEFGGEQYSSRSRMLGDKAQGRGAYVSDMGQSNQSRGQQYDALDMLHGAALGTAPSQAAIQAQAAGDRTLAGNMSMAGSVKGGPGARVAATRAAMAGNAAAGQTIAREAAAGRAGEMATARGQLMQGTTAVRAGDLDAQRIQQQNELAQRQFNDAQQRFFESQGTNIQIQDQNNQLAQQQTAANNWSAGRQATMADEGFGFGKDMTYVSMGAGAAQGGLGAAMQGAGAGAKPDDDTFGSDERMKNVMLSPAEAKTAAPFGAAAIMPMSAPAPASFDQLSPGGGMNVLGSLKAHSDFATRFQSDPSGGMMLSPAEAKVPASLDDGMQRSFDGRGEPGVSYGYFPDPYARSGPRGVTGAPKGYAADRAGQPGSMFSPPGDGGYTREPLADDGQRMAPGTADFEHTTPKEGGGSSGAGILAGVLGGIGGRKVMVSDVSAKKAAFIEGLNYAHEVGEGKPGKHEMPDYVREEKKPAAQAKPAAAPLPAPAEKSTTQQVINHPATQAVARALTPLGGFGYMGALEGGQMGVQYARSTESSDEHTKNVIDLDAPEPGSDRSMMRDGPSDMRVYNADKNFHRDTPADQKRVKRGVEDKASKDADAMMAGFGKSLEQGSSVKPRDGYVPDVEMYAAMKSMKPSVYAYKPEFKPPEQAPGEAQIGPMANPMANTAAATTLVKDPETGLLAIDKDKALKFTMGSLAVLADDVEELKKRKKGGR